MEVQKQKYTCLSDSVSYTNTVSLRQEEKKIKKTFFFSFQPSVGNILIHQKAWCYTFCDTFIWDWTILPAVICLGTLSGMVHLVCEWVISCPWMKSSVVNERHSPNSPSYRWREETKRNSTITRLRGNKCLSLGSNSFPVQHTELFTNYLLPTG